MTSFNIYRVRFIQSQRYAINISAPSAELRAILRRGNPQAGRHRIVRGHRRAVQRRLAIADILIDPEGTRDRRDHWDKTAHTLLTGAILHVLYAEGEKTLARVASFLADPSRSIVRTLRIMLTTNHLGTEDAPQADCRPQGPYVRSPSRPSRRRSGSE